MAAKGMRLSLAASRPLVRRGICADGSDNLSQDKPQRELCRIDRVSPLTIPRKEPSALPSLVLRAGLMVVC